MNQLSDRFFAALVGFLLALGLGSCQSQSSPNVSSSVTPHTPLSVTPNAPPSATVEVTLDGPWSVTFGLTRDAGKSYVSTSSVTVTSEGTLERRSSQNGRSGPIPRITSGKIAPDALVALEEALSDPDLKGGGRGPVHVTWTVNGKTQSAFSGTGNFSGPAGRLVETLSKTTTLPTLERHTGGAARPVGPEKRRIRTGP